MLSRSALVLALAGSTAAFSPMSMSLDRRTIVQAGAVVAPLLRPGAANAGLSSLSDGSKTVGGSAPAAKGGKGGKGMDKSGRAPDILIMDHRGCSRKAGGEYKGAKSGDMNDEMCVKVSMVKVDGGAGVAPLNLLRK